MATDTFERDPGTPTPPARAGELADTPLGALLDRLAPLYAVLARCGRWRPIQRITALCARRHALLAVAIYLTGAVITQIHAVSHLGTVISGNIVGDPTQYMWAMWWWPHAILAGDNPFVTHAIWVPAAYNLGSVTATPLPSLLFAPLTALIGWTKGPVVSYNLANLIAPVISAWFAYRLCLYLSKRPAASVLGGWLYGFSVFGLSQLQGHLNLVFTFLPVVLALLTLQRFDAAISRRRYVALGAVAIIAQIGIGTEIVFTTTCLAVVGVLAALLLAPAGDRRRLVRVIVPELIGAYLLAGVICSPYIYYALSGPAVNPGYNSRFNIADLLSYVVPTPLVRLGQQRFASIASTFPSAAGFEETGTYLGLPLLIGAATYAVKAWRSWGVKVLIIVSAVACLWSLGPTLTIGGHGTLALPWRLLDTQHAFNQISPVRLGMDVTLGASIAFALWLARRSRWWPAKWALALAAVAFVWPNTNGNFSSGQKIYAENVSSPAFFTDGLYKQYLQHDEVVLPLPFGPFGNSLLWQAQSRGYFRLASGWFGYYPDYYASSTVVSEMLGFSSFTDPYRLLHQFIAHTDVGAVVMVAGADTQWVEVMSQLGLKRVSVGGVWVYRVPASLRSS